MSSNEGNDGKLRIPIEIQTEDLKEIQQLIKDISEAESDIRELKPLRGKATDTTSRSATQSPAQEGFGIFSGRLDEEAIPSALRDKKSKQAFERQSAFKELQDKTKALEEQQADLVNVTTNIAQNFGLAGVLTAGSGVGNKAAGAAKDLSSVAGIARNPVKNIGGMITGLSTKVFLPLFVASTVAESVSQVLDLIQAPGGPLDVRFKRLIQNEIAAATEREERAAIRQGIRLIKITPYASFRGIGSSNAAEAYLSGRPQTLIDSEVEYKSKGG